MNTEHNGTMPTPAHVRRLIAELNAAGYEVRPIFSSPPADDVSEADIESLEDFMQDWYDRWAGPGETWVVRDMATSIVEEWLPKVRPYGTVTDTERMEYTIAAESENGSITQLADYTTVVREHLKVDLELYRIEETRAKGDPDRIFIAERPIPKWVRS